MGKKKKKKRIGDLTGKEVKKEEDMCTCGLFILL